MKQYSYMNCKFGKVAFGIFLFAMLLLARDTLITSVILGFNRSQFLMLALICIVGLGFLIVCRRELKAVVTDKRLAVLGIAALVILLPMLLKRDWQMMYFSILLCLAFAVFLTYFKSLQETAKWYVALLSALSVYSLITMYLLKGPAAAGTLAVLQVTNSNDWPFYNFGLSFVVTWEYWNRNFGIFREPGVYQFFLLLGLYLNNYAVAWKKTSRMWLVNAILIVTMLSTFAVGGFIEMGLLAVFLYFDKRWYRTRWGKTVGIGAAAAVLAAAAYILMQMRQPGFEQTVFYEFYDMFIRLFTDSESLTDRFGAIFADIRLFLQNPILGAGIAQVLHAVPNNTSSTLILYAILGIVGGTLNVLAWAALTWKRERCVLGNLILLGILFLSFNTQNLVADVFFWLFPMMALTERAVLWLETRKKKV